MTHEPNPDGLRPWQFSLKTLLLCVTLAAAVSAWIKWMANCEEILWATILFGPLLAIGGAISISLHHNLRAFVPGQIIGAVFGAVLGLLLDRERSWGMAWCVIAAGVLGTSINSMFGGYTRGGAGILAEVAYFVGLAGYMISNIT